MNFDNRGILIPDVSFYQDIDSTPQKVDFARMKSAGAMGVIIRGGQNSWRDPDFLDNWRLAREAGLPRGSYWFFDSRAEPGNQASVWRGLIDGDLPELGLWVDLEEAYKGAWSGERNWGAFLEAVKIQFPKSLVGIYTSDWWWAAQYVLDPAYFAGYPLWVAGYTDNPANVNLPFPWRSRGKQALLWQFTDKGNGPFYGTESLNVDLSYFNGSEQAFRDYFHLAAPSDPPGETGDPMTLYGTVIATIPLNIRSGPGTNNQDIGDLHNGDKLEASESIGGWWKLTKVNGQPVAIESYAYSNAGLYIRTDAQPGGQIYLPEFIEAHFPNGEVKRYLPE